MENQTTVLIADSAEDFCNNLTATLAQSDLFRVVGTVHDGEMALRRIQELKPQVLVLDLMLAKQDGIAVMKALSNMERKPIILATRIYCPAPLAFSVKFPFSSVAAMATRTESVPSSCTLT